MGTMKLHALILSLFCCAMMAAQGQIIFPPVLGGVLPHTNILSGIPGMGTLLIDYQFYQSPDVLDVYINETPIFSSGLVSGSGQFTIPYSAESPSPSTTLSILMNASPGALPNTVWQYVPTVVPVPEPQVWWLSGLGAAALVRWRRRG